MLNGQRIAVVLPAFNAEKTLEATVRELPQIVDLRILVNDSSADETVALGAGTWTESNSMPYNRPRSRPKPFSRKHCLSRARGMSELHI